MDNNMMLPGEITYIGVDQQRKVESYTSDKGREYHKVFRNYYNTWTLEKEYTLKNGYLHSFNDKPAVIERAVEDEWNKHSISGKKWYFDGELHRSSGPAEIEYGEQTGVHNAYKMDWVPINEQFWIHGTPIGLLQYDQLIANIKGLHNQKARELWVDYRHKVTKDTLRFLDNVRKHDSNGKYVEGLGKGRVAATIMGFASPKRFLRSVKFYK